MAGSISAATAIALGSLAVGATGAGFGIYSGMKAGQNQDKSLKNQATATQQAEANAVSTERKNQTATNAANQKAPDISDIMARAAAAGQTGFGSTMLTGPSGAGTGTLGKTSLLGS